MQAQQKTSQDSLTVGTPVMTTCGLYGNVAGLGDDDRRIDIAPGVVVTLARPPSAEVRKPAGDDPTEREQTPATDTPTAGRWTPRRRRPQSGMTSVATRSLPVGRYLGALAGSLWSCTR